MADEAAVLEAADVERVNAVLRVLATRQVSGQSKDLLLELNSAVATMERLVGAIGARCAGEIARLSSPDLPGGGLARREGHGNAKAMLSKIRGGTQAGAQKAMVAGEAFTPVPQAADAPVESAPKPKYPVATAASVSFIPPVSIDPGRTPSPGGSAALDVEIPPPPVGCDLPPITDADEAKVTEWARQDAERFGHRAE